MLDIVVCPDDQLKQVKGYRTTPLLLRWLFLCIQFVDSR